jgi:hypothetical protein
MVLFIILFVKVKLLPALLRVDKLKFSCYRLLVFSEAMKASLGSKKL